VGQSVRRKTVALGVLLTLAGALAACASPEPEPTPTIAAPIASTIPAPAQTTPPPPPAFDKAARSIDDPASIWVVVNRQRPLNPQDYEAGDLVDVPVAHTWEPVLRQEASDSIVAMFDAAANEAGLFLASNSAYRSYSTQVSLYSPDDPTTAPPGTSEHQTGLAMDIGAESGDCSLAECFADTAEGQWLAANAWRFGFLLRFPADKADVTGYPFEPWHYRFIGVDLATEMHNTGVTTLEEFFGLPPAPA
jgi:D-alanyl-D-alanine carboxypeptidase